MNTLVRNVLASYLANLLVGVTAGAAAYMYSMALGAALGVYPSDIYFKYWYFVIISFLCMIAVIIGLSRWKSLISFLAAIGVCVLLFIFFAAIELSVPGTLLGDIVERWRFLLYLIAFSQLTGILFKGAWNFGVWAVAKMKEDPHQGEEKK